MLVVACVRWGEAFGVEYVERLADMVRRNLPDGYPGRFMCLTDNPAALKHLAGVETQLLPVGLEGWWNKISLFRPGAFEEGTRVLYFDLDTCITGPLDRIVQYPGAFGLLRDAYRKDGLQSSVMSFIGGTKLTDSIWSEFMRRAEEGILAGTPPAALWPGGDQEFLEHFWAGGGYLQQRIHGKPWAPDLLQSVLPGCFRSYKVECVWGIPKGTAVVFFHGEPRPHQVMTGWIPQVWKVGGGSPAEFVTVGTVPQAEVLANITVNRAKGIEELEWQETPNALTAVIVGGGPSLAAYLVTIASLQKGGAIVFTVNAVEGYLRQHGLRGTVHVMVDARKQMGAMMRAGGLKLYASMCSPAVIDAAAADPESRLVLWHAFTEGAEELFPKGMMIGGGTTVGVRAMALAYAMGFRKILCVGFDSSYAHGAHHAYPQALNDDDRVLDCVIGGERFKAAPWMIQQAEDWKAAARALTQHGCEVSVFSEGLIGAVARTMNDQFTEVNGIWWPSHDIEARSAVLASLGDCEAYAAMAPGRKVAVQAGGNVGLWPLELARHFEQVHTFEPDPENYACLARNVRNTNIHHYPVALGAGPGNAGIERQVGNCGASRIAPGAIGGPIPVVALDSLALGGCDLLQLDIEGYELEALKGAQQTIASHQPLIVLELKGHGGAYGSTDQEIIDWLEARGYRRSGYAHRDVIFHPLTHTATEDLAHG